MCHCLLQGKGRLVVIQVDQLILAVAHAKLLHVRKLAQAMAGLNPRERHIVIERRLRDEPRTLESLGAELGLSKERIRQLEAAAYGKLRKSLTNASPEVMSFLA